MAQTLVPGRPLDRPGLVPAFPAMRNPWPNDSRLPLHAAAVLSALHLHNPDLTLLQALDDRNWGQALSFADRSRLTLLLRDAARDVMPASIRDRTDQDAAKNAQRLRGIEQLYGGVGQLLHGAGIDFVALKGMTHSCLFGFPANSRVQYDLDLFTPREHVVRAQEALISWGYEPVEAMENFPTDHLPVLIRKTGWEWRGDFFDTAIPVSIEMHFQFWNASIERLSAPGVEEFWSRRSAGALDPPDALAYACLHALKHILRGSMKPFHLYEIAWILNTRSGDFWGEWSRRHSPELRRLQAVVFRLAMDWFGCEIGEAAAEEVEKLPAAVQSWFTEFSTSPAESIFDSNKNELWLHLAMLHSWRDRWSVARRRLFPGNLPPFATTIHIPRAELTWRKRIREWGLFARYASMRLWRHTVALPRTAFSGARWWWKANTLGAQFWIFLSAAVLFNLALFVFTLLYNLYLADLGFHEDFIGAVNGAARIGSLAGTLPAALVAHRLGLRNAFVWTIAGSALVTGLRALVISPVPVTALALISGLIFSLWAVVMAPLIAAAVVEKRRATAFSVFFASMFALGIGGNWLGGRLPGWMHGKQPVLLLSAALIAAAVVPAWKLTARATKSSAPGRIYPRSRFMAVFLVPFALWHLATGSFNPFNNLYFAHLKLSVQQIGTVFSGAQVVQLVAVLLAPLVFRKAGLVPGIVWMMFAAALSLGGLAMQASVAGAATAYAGYMAFQWMSEPGLNTLLMNHVEERERSGASALMYLVAFSAQAVAAFGAGAMLHRWGYTAVLGGASALAAVAALLFRALLA